MALPIDECQSVARQIDAAGQCDNFGSGSFAVCAPVRKLKANL
jgi:hypothetical protein